MVKNLGRGMPESVIRDELKTLNIRVQGVTQTRSGCRDQDPAKEHPPIPTSLYQWREGLSCRKHDHLLNSAACECQWSRMWPQKAHNNTNTNSALDTRSVTVNTCPSASQVGVPTPPVDGLPL